MAEATLKISAVEKDFSTSGFHLGPVSFNLEDGDCLALFGQNGAGKSTLFQIITGNLDPTRGEVLFTGKKLTPEAFELKRRIGYLPQNLDLPDFVTGREMLTYASKLYGFADTKATVAQVMKHWDCESYAHKPLAALSHGMQKRIGLALATMHQPQLLILDEPFSGLDILHLQALNQTIWDRNQRGLATILSTHVVPYAARLCPKAALMQKGQLTFLTAWAQQSYLERIEDVEGRFT